MSTNRDLNKIVGTSRGRMNKVRLISLRVVELNSNMEQLYTLAENGIISEDTAMHMMNGIRGNIEMCLEDLAFYTKKKGDK